MSSGQPEIEFIVWYATEADYLGTRAAMVVDTSDWHDTYAHWKRAAESGLAKSLAKGKTTVCVDIDPAVFVAWCRALQREVDNRALADYASSLVYGKVGAGGGDVLKLTPKKRD